MDLDKKHPLYEANIDRWKYYRASYLGGFDYRTPSLGMLRKYLFEDNAPGNQYSQRLAYTALDNMTKLTVDTYRSFLFRSTPVRTFGNLVDDLSIARFMDDCDFDGQDLNDFMKEANDLATVFGHVWILVTKASVDGIITREQELEANVRPYLRLFTPDAVCDWEYETMPNGQEKLVLVKTREWVSQDTYKYIVWTPEVIYVYLVHEDDIVDTETYPNAIGEVPFVIHYANTTQHKGMGHSDIADVAKSQQAVFNLLSEAEQGIRISNHPTLVKTTDTQASAGAGAVINMDDSMDPALKPYLIEPNGTNIDSIVSMINIHIESFLRSTHLGAIMAARGLQVKSGVALATEFQQLNTRLGDKAAKMEQTEWLIWKLFFKWNGMIPDENFNIEYHKSFDLRDQHADLKLYAEALTLEVDSPTFKQELQKQIAALVINNGDALDEIFAEIEGNSNASN